MQDELTPGEIQAINSMRESFGDLTEEQIRQAVLNLRKKRPAPPPPPPPPPRP